MFSWNCMINGFVLPWIMSYRARICFQSLQETKMAEKNNTPELVLSCLISGPVLTWRDLCLSSCIMLWKWLTEVRDSWKSNFCHTLLACSCSKAVPLFSLSIWCFFLYLIHVHPPRIREQFANNSAFSLLSSYNVDFYPFFITSSKFHKIRNSRNQNCSKKQYSQPDAEGVIWLLQAARWERLQ